MLTCFDRDHAQLTLSEVARRVHSTPASARRSLLTLEALGYVESDGRHFWLLPRALLVAHAFLSSRPMPALAQPYLDALSERTRESASLGQWLDDEAVIVARSTARLSLSTGLGIGSRLPGWCSAMGRVLLAGLPSEDARRRVIAMDRRPLTSRTVVEPKAVLERVERCRAEGFALSDGELEVGVRSMAVPVRDRSGRVVAAMSIALRAERFDAIALREIFLGPLVRARHQLEAGLALTLDSGRR